MAFSASIKLVVEGMTDLNVGDIVFLQRKTIFKIEMFVVDIQIENFFLTWLENKGEFFVKKKLLTFCLIEINTILAEVEFLAHFRQYGSGSVTLFDLT